jgi:hypothetical protein
MTVKVKEKTKKIILTEEEKARETIRLIVDKLKESYSLEKIILFGSYAWVCLTKIATLTFWLLRRLKRHYIGEM